MAKKSRTGKKKKPLYGPQGTLQETRRNEKIEKEAEALKNKGRKYDYGSLALIMVALVIILWKGRTPVEDYDYKVWISIAYSVTIISGFLVLMSNKVRQVSSKVSLVSAYLIIGIGALGIYYTWFML